MIILYVRKQASRNFTSSDISIHLITTATLKWQSNKHKIHNADVMA